MGNLKTYTLDLSYEFTEDEQEKFNNLEIEIKIDLNIVKGDILNLNDIQDYTNLFDTFSFEVVERTLLLSSYFGEEGDEDLTTTVLVVKPIKHKKFV